MGPFVPVIRSTPWGRSAPRHSGMAGILLVEDDADLAALVAHHLRREGFGVVEETDGARAVETARRAPPQLVILDLMLPGLPGLEVCRRIRLHSETEIGRAHV